MDTTTIQVKKETKEFLENMKKSFHTKTFDETIWAIAKKRTPSFYGILAGGKKVSRKKLVEGLRDKHDRY